MLAEYEQSAVIHLWASFPSAVYYFCAVQLSSSASPLVAWRDK